MHVVLQWVLKCNHGRVGVLVSNFLLLPVYLHCGKRLDYILRSPFEIKNTAVELIPVCCAT